MTKHTFIGVSLCLLLSSGELLLAQQGTLAYANGVMVQEEAAQTALDIMANIYKAREGVSAEEFAKLNTKLLYNPTACPEPDGSLTLSDARCLLDFLEAGIQSGHIQAARDIWELEDALISARSDIEVAEELLQKAADAAIQQGEALVAAETLKLFREIEHELAIHPGYMAAVCHSQGNLWCNGAYALLEGAALDDRVTLIPVATPSHSVADGSQHITAECDPIQLVFGALSFSYPTNECEQQDSYKCRIQCHAMQSYRLGTHAPATAKAITSAISDALAGVSRTPSVHYVDFYQESETGEFLWVGDSGCLQSPVGPIRLDVPVTFQIEGENLDVTPALASWIHDCDGMTVTHPPTAEEPYGIATCTPRFTSGIKEGLIKDRPGEDGRELCTFRIEVVDQPIVPCSTWEQVLSTSYGVQALAASPTGYVGFTRFGLLRSIDGDSWTTEPFPGQVHKVIWTGNNFLALGKGMEIWRSDDGVDWQSESLPQVRSLFKYPGGISSNGTTDVVTGSLGGYLWSWPYIWVKQPGENWTLVYRGGAGSRLRDVASNRGSFVITTDHTSIYRGGYENGGLEWEWVDASQPVREVVSTGSEYVAFGNRVERSTDGRSWVGSDFLVGSAPSAIEWTGDRFIGTRYRAVSESFDGLSWTDSVVTDTGGGIRAVADGPGGIVAVGDYGVWKRRSCN